MLNQFSAEGFKSLSATSLGLSRLSLVIGPNAAGKSNFLDALQLFSRLGTQRTLQDAFDGPIRGRTHEAFSLPAGGVRELLGQDKVTMDFGATLELRSKRRVRYEVTIGLEPTSGRLSVEREYLAELSKAGGLKGLPRIEPSPDDAGRLVLRQTGRQGRPAEPDLGANYTQVSDERHSGSKYPLLEQTRAALRGWRTYYFDPAGDMRAATPARDAVDIGPNGRYLAPALYVLQEQDPRKFKAVVRAVRSIVPSVDALAVRQDSTSGDLDVEVTQRGRVFSTRVISEGTLRIIALCVLAATAGPGDLIALEEPENGVHPARLERVAAMFARLAARDEGPQVVLTTHSAAFAAELLGSARGHVDVGLFGATMRGGSSQLRALPDPGLFDASELAPLVEDNSESARLAEMMKRGWLDG
jgi:predicted ATPase